MFIRRKIIACRRGSMMLELALVLPLLLLFIAGIVQFGFILNAKIAVNSASYEGARAATLSEEPQAAAIEAVEGYAGSSLPGWRIGERLKVNIDAADNQPKTPVSVEVSYSVPIFFRNIISFSQNQDSMIDIRGASVMRVEEKE